MKHYKKKSQYCIDAIFKKYGNETPIPVVIDLNYKDYSYAITVKITDAQAGYEDIEHDVNMGALGEAIGYAMSIAKQALENEANAQLIDLEEGQQITMAI